MTHNVLPSEKVGVVGVIDPDAYAPGTENTGWIDASRFVSYLAIVSVGDLGAGATVDAKLEQATNASGAGAKPISGKAITQLTKAGADDNKQALINLRPSELDVEGGFAFFRLSQTVAVAASDAGAHVLGYSPRYSSAGDYDLSSVDEIVR